MVLAHVAISPSNLKSVIHAVKHSPIPASPPVLKTDVLNSPPLSSSTSQTPALSSAANRSHAAEAATAAAAQATPSRPTSLHTRRSTRDSASLTTASSSTTLVPSASTRSSRTGSPVAWSPPAPHSKMHQTSSRLLRMTDEERPFTRVSFSHPVAIHARIAPG
jgi:hypothetical protein